MTLVDPKTGERAVSRVFTREEAYGSSTGRDPGPLPVEQRGTASAGRTASASSTKDMFEDNAHVWSGDHCSLDPVSSPESCSRTARCPPDKPLVSPTCPPRSSHVLGVPAREKLDGVPLFRSARRALPFLAAALAGAPAAAQEPSATPAPALLPMKTTPWSAPRPRSESRSVKRELAELRRRLAS